MIENRKRFILALAVLVCACDKPEQSGWSEPALLVPGGAAAAPMVAAAPDGRIAWAIVSGEPNPGALLVSTGGEPVAIRDTLGPIEPHGEAPPKLAYGADGTLYALYVVARQVPGSVWPAYSLRVVKSRDGKTFEPPTTVTRDTVFGAFNFHALHVADDGAVYVGFLRGEQGKSAAYLARSLDVAVSWEPAVRLEPGEACPCCRTAIASHGDGNVFTAWRTVLPGDVRDIVVTRSADRGSSWTTPKRVHDDNWVFPGCPHAGPALMADSAGVLHAAWWTAATGRGGVYYAQSTDGGVSFSTPVHIDPQDHPRAAHPQLAIGGNGTVFIAWERYDDQGAQVFSRVSRDAGKTFEPSEKLSASMLVSGFPVVALSKDSVLVAWSEENLQAIENREAEHDAAVKEGKPVPLHTASGAKVWVRRAALTGGR